MAAEEMTSDELRRKLSWALPRVQLRGLVVRVRRYNESVAVLVPPDWYDRAVEAIGLPPVPDSDDPAT